METVCLRNMSINTVHKGDDDDDDDNNNNNNNNNNNKLYNPKHLTVSGFFTVLAGTNSIAQATLLYMGC